MRVRTGNADKIMDLKYVERRQHRDCAQSSQFELAEIGSVSGVR